MPFRRLAALAALLAFCWSAMWPLVANARARTVAMPHWICTQGAQKLVWLDVPADTAPAPAAGEHCPLCVPASNAPPSDPLRLVLPAAGVVIEHAFPEGEAARIQPHRQPPGRAPPLDSPA